MKTPTLALTGTSTATSYHFRAKPPEHHWGWAICTINDGTGELQIMSDWGNWAFRWNVLHVGPSRYNRYRTATLTEFIGDRSDDGLDYLACKLTTREEREEFDPDETTRKWRKQLCDARLAFGREHGPDESFSYGWRDRHTRPALTRDLARELWETLGGELSCTTDVQLFLERTFHIDGWLWFTHDRAWEDVEHRRGAGYEILMHTILPALRDAAADRARAMQPAPPPIGWAGDLELIDLARRAS